MGLYFIWYQSISLGMKGDAGGQEDPRAVGGYISLGIGVCRGACKRAAGWTGETGSGRVRNIIASLPFGATLRGIPGRGWQGGKPPSTPNLGGRGKEHHRARDGKAG